MRIRICLLCQFLLPFVSFVEAQTATGSSPRPGLANEQAARVQLAKTDAEAVRAKVASLRQISESKPGTREARDALVEEVFTLGRLASVGDAKLDHRRRDLAEKLSKDHSLPTDDRHRVAAFSANVDVINNRSLEFDQRMDAFAQVAWRMAKEFPDRPDRYASLLRIAADSNDTQARSIAEGVLAADAPDEIKAQATLLLGRLGLVGQNVRILVGDNAELPEANAPVCLLAWSQQSPGTLNAAKFIRTQLPPNATILAVCLDGDTPDARDHFYAQGLNLTAVFPNRALDSGLCKTLYLYGPAVYLTDSKGLITTVSGINWLKKHRSNKAKKEGKR